MKYFTRCGRRSSSKSGSVTLRRSGGLATGVREAERTVRRRARVMMMHVRLRTNERQGKPTIKRGFHPHCTHDSKSTRIRGDLARRVGTELPSPLASFSTPHTASCPPQPLARHTHQPLSLNTLELGARMRLDRREPMEDSSTSVEIDGAQQRSPMTKTLGTRFPSAFFGHPTSQAPRTSFDAKVFCERA